MKGNEIYRSIHSDVTGLQNATTQLAESLQKGSVNDYIYWKDYIDRKSKELDEKLDIQYCIIDNPNSGESNIWFHLFEVERHARALLLSPDAKHRANQILEEIDKLKKKANIDTWYDHEIKNQEES